MRGWGSGDRKNDSFSLLSLPFSPSVSLRFILSFVLSPLLRSRTHVIPTLLQSPLSALAPASSHTLTRAICTLCRSVLHLPHAIRWLWLFFPDSKGDPRFWGGVQMLAVFSLFVRLFRLSGVFVFWLLIQYLWERNQVFCSRLFSSFGLWWKLLDSQHWPTRLPSAWFYQWSVDRGASGAGSSSIRWEWVVLSKRLSLLLW